MTPQAEVKADLGHCRPLAYENGPAARPKILRTTRKHDETDGRTQCLPVGPSGDRTHDPSSAGSRSRFSAGRRDNQAFRGTGGPRLGGASRPFRTSVATAGGGYLFASAPQRSCRVVGTRAWQNDRSETSPWSHSAKASLRWPNPSLARPTAAATVAPM